MFHDFPRQLNLPLLFLLYDLLRRSHLHLRLLPRLLIRLLVNPRLVNPDRNMRALEVLVSWHLAVEEEEHLRVKGTVAL